MLLILVLCMVGLGTRVLSLYIVVRILVTYRCKLIVTEFICHLRTTNYSLLSLEQKLDQEVVEHCKMSPAPEASGRVDRYPLLPSIFASIYPNPPAQVNYDPENSQAAAPVNEKCSGSVVAGFAMKMDNAPNPAAYEAGE